MGLISENSEGQTPLDESEIEGLRINSITTRGELDEFEQKNIEEAIQWAVGINVKAEDVFSETFICSLHKRMYKEVWSWAGEFRTSNKNIGIEYYQISTALRQLLDDALYWFRNGVYSPEELALRFKHRLVSIHCFPNGNGRHSRLMADIIIEKLYNKSPFSWGAKQTSDTADSRNRYLQSLKLADKGDYSKLIKFASE